MPLNESVLTIFKNLEKWAGFPKYALERRLDIFLTPFLAPYLSWRLQGTASLVAPEFPILASLRPKPKKATKPPKREPPPGLTVNADYLFHIDRTGKGAWILLELKTDRGSFDSDQHAIYQAARSGVRPAERTVPGRPPSPMARLLNELELVERATKSPGKYEELRKDLRKFDHSGDPIEIVYLAPSGMKGFAKATAGTSTVLLTLEDFAVLDREHVPAEHAALWTFVSGLLTRRLALSSPAPATASRA